MADKIPCFAKVNIPDLAKLFDSKYKEGMSEAEQRQIGTDIALDYHKKLFEELNTFKEKDLKIKLTKEQKTYVSPDKSEAIKKITDDYQKQIDEANTPISEPVKAPVTKSEGGKAESIVEGERENVREHWALSNEYRINELAEQATSEKHFKELIDKEIELESKKTPKLAQDDAESKYAVGKLTEQNQPSEELVKNIERKAESQSEADLNEVVQKADELIDTAVGVKRKKLSEINTDESRFQGRGKLNEGIVNEISKNFSDADQDPIHIWADPKDGKTYVLSGHHRYYGAKKAGRADVKVIDRTKDFTEQQAIKFAKEEANANRSMETPLERANTLREKRQRGDDKKDIAAFLDKEGKNKTFVDNLSYLNPKGKAVELLTQFERAEDKQTQKESERIADWIGEARKRNENLINQHENEMFDYLKSEQRVTNKVEFVEKVSKASFGIRENEPLNLKKVIDKSENRIDWEDKRDELKSQVNELKSQTEKDKQTGWTGLQKDYITRLANDRFKGDADAAEKEFKKTENQEIYNKKLEDKKAELKSIQDKLAKHLLKENDLIKGDKAQQNLFEEPEPEYGKIISIDKNNPTTVEIKGEERKLPTKPAKDKQLTYTVSGFGGNGAVVTIHETPTVKGYNSGKIQHSEIFNTFNEAFEYADRLKKANVKQLYEYQSEKENKTLPATGRDITDGGRTTSLVSENNPQYGNDSPYQKALRKVREKTPQSLNETKQEPTKDIKPEQAESQPQPEKTIVEDKQGAGGKYEEKARKIADKILKAELPDWAKADLPEGTKKAGGDFESIKKAIANATIEMGKLLDKGVEFSEAVKKAVKDIVDILGEGSRDKIEKGFAEDYKKDNPEFKEPVNKEGEGDNLPERRFTKQMLRSDELSDVSKAEISKTLNYTRQTNEMSLKEASDIIDRVGLEEAQNLVMTDGDIKPAVRVTLGQTIIKKYNELSQKAEKQEDKDYYLDKTIQTANFVTEKLATEPGQMIQAFSMWARLSPEGQLRAASQDMAKQGKEKMRRREKDINKIADKFKKANEEAADEVIKSDVVKETVTKDSNEKIAKAKDKVSKAKQKRADIIKKYKENKGKNLFSSPTGLTPEGIEFVGEVAKTYIQEGVANLEVLVQKVLAHLEDVAGKKATDEIKKQVQEEADKAFNKSDMSLLGKALRDKNIKISEVVKKHYTEVDRAKKNLTQKLMDEADMSQSNAAELAKKVEAAFDRIATRKKRNILYNEKARFDKINNTLKGDKKPEPKTVQSDIIKYSNLGGFDNADFSTMLGSKFGIGKISKEQAAKLIELADKIQKAPEGSPKNAATEDLLAYRAKLRGNDWGETAQSVWYANVLSGYRTHEKNLVSTFFNSMGELGAEMAKEPKAIPYIMAGYFKGISKRGLVEAAHTMKTGRSPIHIKKIEVPNVLERKNFKYGVINPGNWFKYVMRLMVATDVVSFQGLKEARAYQLARREAQGQGYNTWSKKGWDKVNELLYHTKERYREAELQAQEEGLKPKTVEHKRRIYELMENSRPQEMVEDTYGFAAKGTFNHESEGSLGAITNAVASSLDAVSVGGVKPLRFIVPFTRIITNVVNNSLDYTPVGFVRAARGVRGFKSFEKNQFTKGAFKELSKEERQRYLAKAAIGITLTATLQALHQAGVIQITGGGTGDWEKDKQLRESGWQPYSIKIGDTYYSYQYTPLVFMTGFLGNMNDAARYGDEDEQTLMKRGQIALSRIGGQVADMTWINSASTFLGALTEKNPDKQAKGIKDLLASTTRGFIPFAGAITQTNQAVQSAFSMPQKQVNGSFQALIQDIPIARNSLNDKVNALGDPIVRDIDVVTSKETQDPVMKFLLDKEAWVSSVNKNTISVYDDKLKMERPITDDEYYEFSKQRGKLLKDVLAKIEKKGMYVTRKGQSVYRKADDITTKELQEVITKLSAKATKAVKAKMFGEKETDEDLKEAIRETLEGNKNIGVDIEVEENE